MQISQSQFNEKISQNSLRIALIGMSNIGKSHWARQIENNHNFTMCEIDMGIQRKLSLPSMNALALWMGQPYEKNYAGKVEKYLDHEKNLTLSAARLPGNLVLDTTGSVVHLQKPDLARLQEQCLIVYLKASETSIDVLIERFSTSPKPLIWGEYYKDILGQTHYESLINCYPNLLQAREERYNNLADVTLPTENLEEKKDFLAVLSAALPISI